MKLKTLLDYQRSFDMLRNAEIERRMVNSTEFMDAIRAKSVFDYELAQHIKDTELETT